MKDFHLGNLPADFFIINIKQSYDFKRFMSPVLLMVPDQRGTEIPGVWNY